MVPPRMVQGTTVYDGSGIYLSIHDPLDFLSLKWCLSKRSGYFVGTFVVLEAVLESFAQLSHQGTPKPKQRAEKRTMMEAESGNRQRHSGGHLDEGV